MIAFATEAFRDSAWVEGALLPVNDGIKTGSVINGIIGAEIPRDSFPMIRIPAFVKVLEEREGP